MSIPYKQNRWLPCWMKNTDLLPQPSEDTNYLQHQCYQQPQRLIIARTPKAENCPPAIVVREMRITSSIPSPACLPGFIAIKTHYGIVRRRDVVVSKPTGILSGTVEDGHGIVRSENERREPSHVRLHPQKRHMKGSRIATYINHNPI